MILTHTDYGRTLFERLAAQDSSFDTLFFLRRDALAIGGGNSFYEQLQVSRGDMQFYLDVRFTQGADGTRSIASVDLFDSAYVRLATALEIGVPVTAGSLSYKDDTLYLTGAADRLFDDGGKDFVDLGAGNDFYGYRTGNDRILGGPGLDTVAIPLPLDKVTITRSGQDLALNLGTDAISMNSVERVRFFDGHTLALDIGAWETAGGVYRLYQAAFARVPDSDGLRYWITQLDAGHGDLKWAATNFILSQEFQTTYGTAETVSNAAFVSLLYENVLHRSADGAGAQYWIDGLGAGVERSSVLLSFSESSENQTNVLGVIHDGVLV